MITSIKRWWKRRKIKLAEEDAKFQRWEQEQENKQKRAELKKSKTPWVTITGENPTEEGLKLELDWNDAFIEMLRESGYKGISEDQLVGKWLLQLQQQLVSGEDDEQESKFE
jgi:hypothetical protein